MRGIKNDQYLEIDEVFVESRKASRFLELLIAGKVFKIFYLGFVSVALVFSAQLLLLWRGEGSFYEKRALGNINQETAIPAERGTIFDRFGIPVAQNQPIFSASLKVAEYLKNRGEIEAFLYESIGLVPENLLEIVSKADLKMSDSVIIARDLEPEEIIRLKGRELPGLQIADDFRRFYPGGAVFSHLLGYANQEGSGVSGLELFYEEALRGKSGTLVKQKNSKGEALEGEERHEPEKGKNLSLAVDGEFQKYFYERLLEGLNGLGRKSGAGLAIDPRNGEVLAMVSFPSFDSNLFTKRGNKTEQAEKMQLLSSPDKPLFNRVISGVYNPGSTIKPLHGLAALTEGVITPQETINSIGYIELPNPYNPDQPSRFLDWRAHVFVDIRSAIAPSAHAYFYEVGGGFNGRKGLGIERLIEWWEKFGFGKKTGTDFPGEGEGFLPNPEEKEVRTGRIWRIGDTYNVSIGQGDLLLTPLQLLGQIAAIANGGKLFTPHFAKDMEPVLSADFSNLSGSIEEIRLGMRDSVRMPYGTSYLLADLPAQVAAKTGSAQIENNTKTNAFFVGFAPYEGKINGDPDKEPKIAILILVENAKEGSLNVVPIAKDVLAWYYEHRLKNVDSH